MRTYKIVKVDWVDSCNWRGWRDKKEAIGFTPSTCVSGGILTKTKRGSIGVAHSISEESIGDTVVIPRKCIKGIEILTTFRI